jgi:hypothetical protein
MHHKSTCTQRGRQSDDACQMLNTLSSLVMQWQPPKLTPALLFCLTLVVHMQVVLGFAYHGSSHRHQAIDGQHNRYGGQHTLACPAHDRPQSASLRRAVCVSGAAGVMQKLLVTRLASCVCLLSATFDDDRCTAHTATCLTAAVTWPEASLPS